MKLERYLPTALRARYSLKLLGVSLFIICVIVTIGAVTALQVSDRVAQEQLSSLEANAELEADALGQWIEGERESVRLLSNHEGLEPANRDQTRETLRAEREEMPDEVAQLYLVKRTPDGFSEGTDERILASTERAFEDESLAATEIDWNPEVGYNFDSESDVILSWVYMDGDRPSVALASPTPDGEHVLVAEYRTNVRAEQFTSVVAGTETLVLGGFTSYVLFDANESNVMTEYDGDRENTTIGSLILDSDPFAELSGSVLTDDEVKGYHSVPSDEVDWVIVKEAPRSTALGLTNQVQSDLLLLILLMLFGFLLVGAVIQRGPLHAIQRLATQANAISRGELSAEIEDEDRIDEVGQVRSAFRSTKAYIETITKQSEALSRQEFDADVLDKEIPGRVGESMATMRTDLERFIDKIEAERERYTTLVEQSSDGVIVVKDGQCVFANDRVVEILGYDRELLFEIPFVDLVVPEDRDLVRERYEQRSHGDSPPEQDEIDMETASGERRTIGIAVSRIEHDGEPALLVSVRDVTERKRREQRLEVFNRLLRHNLRNELDVIRSHAEVLAADSDGRHTGQIMASTETLATLGNRARTIDSILSRDVEETNVDISAVLAGILDSQAVTDGKELRTEIPETAPVVTDREVLETVLQNPIENAVAYAESVVRITVEHYEERYSIRIEDDGPGIPQHELESLETGTETALGHGRGLGLWQLKWGIDKLNGDVSFDTTGGTTVHITLPDRITESAPSDTSP